MKLYFNGCSYVHGDDLVWDYEKNPSSLNLQQDAQYLLELSKHRLSTRVGKKLGLKSITDHSGCGASNQLILFQTLEYFESLSIVERKDHIACIGWTAAPRMTFIIEPENRIECVDITILPMWIDNMKKRSNKKDVDLVKTDFLETIEPMHKPLVMVTNNHYWYKEHLQSILCLQNYFDFNQIPYVFWNSLDNSFSNELWFKALNQSVRWDAWIDFKYPAKGFPPKAHKYEHSWISRYYELKYKSKSNHPNHASVESMSDHIVDHIRTNGIL